MWSTSSQKSQSLQFLLCSLLQTAILSTNRTKKIQDLLTFKFYQLVVTITENLTPVKVQADRKAGILILI